MDRLSYKDLIANKDMKAKPGKMEIPKQWMKVNDQQHLDCLLVLQSH
jgi:hypothetical protein